MLLVSTSRRSTPSYLLGYFLIIPLSFRFTDHILFVAYIFRCLRYVCTCSAEETNSEKKVTPFEKNLEVWRQLWRVMERSDLICQLVDARNPLFYYSSDLEAYASELVPPKPMVVVVNKADYLSRLQLNDWVRHFEGRGITVLFFSARAEQERLNRQAREGRDSEESGVGGARGGGDDDAKPATVAAKEAFDSEEESEEEVSDAETEEQAEEGDDSVDRGSRGESQTSSGRGGTRDASPRVLGRLEMCIELERLARTLGAGPAPDRNGGRACVGMVGYPNVGKSSLINVLVGATPLSHGGVRVSVGATPGKTKHFQTLVLSDSLMLCDCPGLVFPSFVSRYVAYCVFYLCRVFSFLSWSCVRVEWGRPTRSRETRFIVRPFSCNTPPWRPRASSISLVVQLSCLSLVANHPDQVNLEQGSISESVPRWNRFS